MPRLLRCGPWAEGPQGRDPNALPNREHNANCRGCAVNCCAKGGPEGIARFAAQLPSHALSSASAARSALRPAVPRPFGDLAPNPPGTASSTANTVQSATRGQGPKAVRATSRPRREHHSNSHGCVPKRCFMAGPDAIARFGAQFLNTVGSAVSAGCIAWRVQVPRPFGDARLNSRPPHIQSWARRPEPRARAGSQGRAMGLAPEM